MLNLGLGFELKANASQALGELEKLARGLMAIQDHARRAGQALDLRVATGFSQAARAARGFKEEATKIDRSLRDMFDKTAVMSPLMAPDKTAIHRNMGAYMAVVREQHKLAQDTAKMAEKTGIHRNMAAEMAAVREQHKALKNSLNEQNERLNKQKAAWRSIGDTLSHVIIKAARYTFMLGVGGAAGIARAAGGKVGFALPSLSGKYEQELANIRAVAGGTPEEFQAVKEEISHIANITRYTPHQIAEAFRHIRVSGKDTTESIKLLGAAATIAQASFGKLSAPKSGEMIAAMTKQFALNADEADRFAAAMVRTQQVSALHIHEMQRVFRQFGSVSMFDKRKGGPGGFESMTDMLAIAGALRSTGLPAEMAGRYAKSSFVNIFAGKLNKVEALFKEHGKAAVIGPDNQIRRPLEVVADLMDIFEKMPTGDRAKTAKSIIGKDVLGFLNLATFQKQINGVTYQGAEAIRALSRQYSNLTGVTKEFNETLLKTWEGTKLLLEGPVSDLAERLKLPMQEHMRKSLGPVIGMLNQFLEVIRNSEGELKQFSVALVGGLGLLHFINLMHDARHILFSIIKLPLQLAAALITLAVAIPVVLAFGTALYGIYVVMQTIGDRITGGFGNIGQKIALFWQGLMELMGKGGFSSTVDKEMSKAENQGVRKWVIGVGMAIHRVRAFFEGFALGLDLDKIGASLSRLGSAFLELMKAIGRLIGLPETSSLMKMMTPDLWKSGQKAGESFTKSIIQGLTWLTEKVQWLTSPAGLQYMQDLWKGIKSTVHGIVTAVLAVTLGVILVVKWIGIFSDAVGGADNLVQLVIGAWITLLTVKLVAAIAVARAAMLGLGTSVAGAAGTAGVLSKVGAGVVAGGAVTALGVVGGGALVAALHEKGKIDDEKQRKAFTVKSAPELFRGLSPAAQQELLAARTQNRGATVETAGGAQLMLSREDVQRIAEAVREGAKQGTSEAKVAVEGLPVWGSPFSSGAAAK